MDHPAFISTEKKHEYPILVVDKLGIIGAELVNSLKQEALVIFVSRKQIEEENVIHIPFIKKIPTIPDNTYSHIFLIDEYGSASKDLLSSFVKKAKHDNSVLTFCAQANTVSLNLIDNYISSYNKTKIILIGDVFAKDFIYDKTTYINKFIKEVREFNRITVPKESVTETVPVYLEDVILGILQATFIDNSENSMYLLYPKHKPTLLSIAHMFQKIDPDLKIDFEKENTDKSKKEFLVTDGKYLLEENYDLQSRIKKIDLGKKEIEEVDREDIEEEQVNEKNKLSYIFFGTCLTLIFFFLLPFITTITLALSGAFVLNNLKQNIQTGNFSNARNSAFSAYGLFNFAKNSNSLLYAQTKFIGQEKKLNYLSEKINQGAEISHTALTVLDSFEKIKSVVSTDSVGKVDDFTKSLDGFKNALIVYQHQKDAGNIPKLIEEKLKGVISFVSTTVDLWPEILGFKDKKTYLVLFQNNMELRPGGGFIGSYGILSLQEGKVKDFKIYDVYDADGQLKGHVEPPFAIRRYLPSVNWYLRDSNFNTDFSKGAIASAIFLNTEMQQGVDGVIGVDLSFVKNLLSVIGPVRVADYSQSVTTENFYKITQEYAENNFFPGSTQKKDFLRSLFNSIKLKLSNEKNVSYFNILDALTKSLEEKHIVFAFNSTDLQSVFSVNGWGSTLFDERKSTDMTINDFIGINEANLGANKVNYFITRSISQRISIESDGSVSENLRVSFKNNADKSLKAKGLYKNYFRVILPFGTELKSIEINGSSQKITDAITDPALYEKKNFVPPSALEVEKQSENGKTTYGFLVVLQAEELKTIDISYKLSNKLNLKKSDFLYDLKIFKQPGIDEYPYDLSIVLPQNLTAINVSKQAKFKNQTITFVKQVVKDQDISFTFAKQ